MFLKFKAVNLSQSSFPKAFGSKQYTTTGKPSLELVTWEHKYTCQ